MKTETLEALREVICAHGASLELEEITPDKTLKQLGLDSLDMILIHESLEGRFDMFIDFDANLDWTIERLGNQIELEEALSGV